MITIANFSSVLEIAFASNALVFIFEMAPSADSRLERKLKYFYELRDKKVELTKNHEAFPIGFVLNSTYTTEKYLLALIAIILSIAALGFLIYSGFVPEAQMGTYWFAFWLALFFLAVPILWAIIYIRATRLLSKEIEHMEDQVSRAERGNVA